MHVNIVLTEAGLHEDMEWHGMQCCLLLLLPSNIDCGVEAEGREEEGDRGTFSRYLLL